MRAAGSSRRMAPASASPGKMWPPVPPAAMTTEGASASCSGTRGSRLSKTMVDKGGRRNAPASTKVACPVLDLTVPRRIHVVGAGGAGMSAIADVLSRMGHRISGSDLKPSANLERLKGLGIEVWVGHDAGRVGAVDAVAISTAVPPTNPEVVAATERRVPVLRRAEVLAGIVATRRTAAV